MRAGSMQNQSRSNRSIWVLVINNFWKQASVAKLSNNTEIPR